MVIVNYSPDNKFKITKSDSNKYIKQIQTGHKYTVAKDLIDSVYEYEETDEEIVKPKVNEVFHNRRINKV